MTSSTLSFAFLMGQSPMELFKHGGYIMWPILLCSFICMTAVIERVIFIVRENLSREPEVVEKMLQRVATNDINGALEIGKKSGDFITRILTYALTHKEQSLTGAFVRASNQEMRRYSQGMPAIDTCITAAPLLGLLGTVTGMMNTFGALGAGADIGESSAQITGGVAEALIATASGLVIALIGLIPFNYLNSKTEEAKHEISDASNALEILVRKSSTEGVHA